MLKKTFFALALLGTPAALFGQASTTASRAADLQIGAGFSNANTDYLTNRVNGITGYFTYDFYHHFGVEGDFRFLKDGGTNIYEKTYQIGGRYSRVYRTRYQPYLKVMYGRGVFNYTLNKAPYANLAYNMMVVGGGLDYHLLRFLNIRGDYEYQRWFGFPNGGLSPQVITLGVAYHFPPGKLAQHQ